MAETKEKLDRVVITQPVIGICFMQVCAVKDVTDEEILRVCNSQNPSGTTNGWNGVIRENMKDCPDSGPKQCAEYEDRLHFLVAC
jgi:hypothetical protein